MVKFIIVEFIISEFIISLLGLLYCILGLVLIFHATPFFWAYIFGRKVKKLRKILYFMLAFLLWHEYTIIPPRIMEIQTYLLFYKILDYVFLSSYLIGIIYYIQRLKTSVFRRISISIISTLIFVSASFLIFVEGEIISQQTSSEGVEMDMRVLEDALNNFIKHTSKGYYPTHHELQEYVKTHRDYINNIVSWQLGEIYELTSKRYAIKDNNIMIAWSKEVFGVVLKWRWIMFIRKKEFKIISVFERTFQKLLKEQQGDKK